MASLAHNMILCPLMPTCRTPIWIESRLPTQLARSGGRTFVAALTALGMMSACGEDDGGGSTEPAPMFDGGLDDFGSPDGANDGPDAGPAPTSDPDAGTDPSPDSGSNSDTDAGFAPDGSADAIAPGCAPAGSPVAPGTLAFYRFDSDEEASVVEDSMAAYPGSVHGAITRGSGREECGYALDFSTAHPDASTNNFVEIPHAPAWDLPQGSVDFWVRMDSLPVPGAGLISRDAAYIEQAGHLTILLNAEGRVIVRLQRMGTDRNDRIFLCSDAPLQLSEWTHVEFRFGLPYAQLFVNGELATYAEEVTTGLSGSDSTGTCGGLWIDGIDGNENPWVIGAASVASQEGAASPLSLPFETGAIDDVRIRGPRDGQQTSAP